MTGGSDLRGELEPVPTTFNFGTDVVDRRAKTDDREALVAEAADGTVRMLRYSELAEATDRFAAALRRRDIVSGDRVIVMLPRGLEWAIAMISALKIGAVPVPCIEMLTARDLAYRVENSEARAIICRGHSVVKFGAVDSHAAVRVALDAPPDWLDYESLAAEHAGTFKAALVMAEDPAVMYYTSGSTGHPKGVLHAARALFAWRNSARHWLDLSPGQRIWCTADTGWSKAGTSILFGPLSCGATSFLYDGPFEPAHRLDFLARHRINVYCAPATELNRVAAERFKEHDLGALRRTVSAGEAVSTAISQRWQAASGLRIAEGYGQTEALMLAVNRPGETVRAGSMGRPLPGCELAVIDADGRRLPNGVEGELALRSPNPQLMLGYWREAARTAAAYRDGPEGSWYVTGDLAAFDDDGYLWFRGRADDVINSAGYRIGPMEIENVLMEHTAVSGCAVVGTPDTERGEIVTAFVVVAQDRLPGDQALRQELQDHVKAATAPYKYPRRIEFVPSLPLGPTGKVDRRSLRDVVVRDTGA